MRHKGTVILSCCWIISLQSCGGSLAFLSEDILGSTWCPYLRGMRRSSGSLIPSPSLSHWPPTVSTIDLMTGNAENNGLMRAVVSQPDRVGSWSSSDPAQRLALRGVFHISRNTAFVSLTDILTVFSMLKKYYILIYHASSARFAIFISTLVLRDICLLFTVTNMTTRL